tara:strand:- start:162 stop:665 length:504 start_codon:yes stop_codon:yes gene_type:complete
MTIRINSLHNLKLTGLMLLLFLLMLLTPIAAFTQVDAFQFSSEEQQQRFRQLSDELRCPMCQNTNLTGSTGGVAEDLRREIHRMIIEGLTDEEIEQFMFERYGDFIFYRPRLRADTVLLWFGPLIFLFIGGFVTYGIFRRAKALNKIEVAFDESQQKKLEELLTEKL